MSKIDEEILNKLRELSKQLPVIVPALVKSVNETDNTCEVEIEGLQYTCRLNAAQASVKGFVIIPAVNSSVLVARLDDEGNIYTLIHTTEISKIITFNGQIGGMANTPELKTQLDRMSARIDVLENAIKNGAPASGSADGGAAYKASMIVIIDAGGQKENFNNIENENFLQ